MKRTEALVLLSRDHHQALVIAQRLRRADTATASAARRALLDYWDAHGRIHFQREEELLLPAYAGYGDAHGPLVARVLCDHVAIRHDIQVIRTRPWTVDSLRRLGTVLADHVRLEERELFPLIEGAMPDQELLAVAAALEHAMPATPRG